MKKFSETEAKEIGNDLKINWDKISLDAFTKGMNVELEQKQKNMKKIQTFGIVLLLSSLITLSGCEIIGEYSKQEWE